jgi:hypothetical protein
VEKAKATAVAKSLKATAASTRNQQQSQRGRQQQQQQQTPDAGTPVAAASTAVGEGPARTPGYNVAYVGNIAFEARPEDISALFESCNVTKVRQAGCIGALVFALATGVTAETRLLQHI